MTIDRVDVTGHALDRWRHRVAPAGDAGRSDVESALRRSRLVAPGEPLPVPRFPNTTYYHHAMPECWFVVEAVTIGWARLVTVLVRNYATNPLNPKFAYLRKAALEERAEGVPA